MRLEINRHCNAWLIEARGWVLSRSHDTTGRKTLTLTPPRHGRLWLAGVQWRWSWPEGRPKHTEYRFESHDVYTRPWVLIARDRDHERSGTP